MHYLDAYFQGIDAIENQEYERAWSLLGPVWRLIPPPERCIAVVQQTVLIDDLSLLAAVSVVARQSLTAELQQLVSEGELASLERRESLIGILAGPHARIRPAILKGAAARHRKRTYQERFMKCCRAGDLEEARVASLLLEIFGEHGVLLRIIRQCIKLEIHILDFSRWLDRAERSGIDVENLRQEVERSRRTKSRRVQ